MDCSSGNLAKDGFKMQEGSIEANSGVKNMNNEDIQTTMSKTKSSFNFKFFKFEKIMKFLSFPPLLISHSN